MNMKWENMSNRVTEKLQRLPMRLVGRLGLAGLMAMILLPMSSRAGEAWTEIYGTGSKTFSLATGSPGELGLLKALATPFTAKTDSRLAWRKAGSGESLKLLKAKAVDMVMVHSADAERKAVKDSWAAQRTLLGSNEFYILGPADDLAGIAQAKTAAEAYSRIAKAEQKFYSRGDHSGTHVKELAVWKAAGITPSGAWYVVTKDFMAPTMKRANDEGGYFMTDSSTWVAEKVSMPKLKLLFRGDRMLVNIYHALRQPDATASGVALAGQFIDFVASEEGQKIIRGYGKDKHGEGLYNDATYAAKYDGPAEPDLSSLTGRLFVYCAAGVKGGVDAVAKAFETERGVKVELTYANSGQLLGQIETTRTGDVYIPGDVGFAAKAEARKLTVGKPKEFCYFVPAIYVRKGNPKGIRDVSDLVRPGLKLALADPSAAVGQLQGKLFKKNNIDEAALKKNTSVAPATVTDVAMAVKVGTVDAGIIWDALANYAPDEAELVRIPVEKNEIGIVAACVLAGSKNPEAARAFLDYLVSEKGQGILKGKGFTIDKP